MQEQGKFKEVCFSGLMVLGFSNVILICRAIAKTFYWGGERSRNCQVEFRFLPTHLEAKINSSRQFISIFSYLYLTN